MIGKLVIIIFVFAVAGGATALVLHFNKVKAASKPTTVPMPATLPTSQPITRHVAKPKYPTYMEVVRKDNPLVAATQPLDYNLELPDAAHLILHDPTYLDGIGNLWITRKDGQPLAKALVKPSDDEEHIINERPVFVHWWTNTDTGAWSAAVVVRADKGGYDLVTKKSREHLADDRPYNWKSAYSINSLNKFVVCTDVGVSVFNLVPKIEEHYHALPGCDVKTNPPVTLLDTRGVLAWAPWESGKPGSAGVSRFVDEKWTELPAKEWPDRPIQLSLLLDNSVLRIAAGIPPSNAPPTEGVEEGPPPDQFADQVHLSIGQIEPTNFDRKRLDELIVQLSNDDADARQAAFDELSRYGPAIAPLLEKVADNQLPATRTRIRQLLRSKITPALGGFNLVDGRLDVIRRCADGTVLFYAPAGIEIPNESDQPEVMNPAWLAMRGDGKMERPLSAALTKDQKPEICTIYSVKDEWITNDETGIQRLVGPSFQPLLKENEKRFNEVVNLGIRHRWVLRDKTSDDTLVIDPGIVDPTPKLPTWVIATPKGTAGWDKRDFPALDRGEAGGTWSLLESGWTGLDKNEKVLTEVPPATQPAMVTTTLPTTVVTTAPTTSPATSPATSPTTLPTTNPTTLPVLGNPILYGSDGRRYYDGKSSIILIRKDGRRFDWPLPASATGTAEPTLLQTRDGLLFLFNQAGRLLRIRPTPDASEPFRLEATFTKDIPNVDDPLRIWLDPAGRIDFVSEQNVLTITFPSGTIPKAISRMMLEEKH